MLNFGGVADLPGFVAALRNEHSFRTVTSLGIVLDAEGQRGADAFKDVQAALGAASLPVPAAHATPAPGPPRIQVFILPDGNAPGMLETLYLRSVAADPVMPCLEEYLACAERAQGRPSTNIDKARTHAYLATRPRPAIRLREAANAGYWSWNDPSFAALQRFLFAL